MEKILFNTPGLQHWTCPDGVTGVVVELAGPGGDGGSTTGGGGGAYARLWLDVSPGHVYDVFVADKTGEPTVSYFATPTTVAAARASGTSGGARLPTIGTAAFRGRDGSSSGSGGASGGSFYDLGSGSGGGPGSSGSFPGGGGGSGAQGAGGGVRIFYWLAATGGGGGGGGGYARQQLDVTPTTSYELYVGRGGYGQQAMPGVNPAAFVSYSPRLDAEDSWFLSPSQVCGRGGQSAGAHDGAATAIPTGALGGGQPGTPANVGAVTFLGGNGGDGHGASKLFAFLGGGGGAAGSYEAAGADGRDGRESGQGGWSANNFHQRLLVGFYPRGGSGGNGFMGSLTNAGWGTAPGGGGGGNGANIFHLAASRGGPGAAGRVLISGTRTGQLLVPGF
jgi:hypothetical protein